MSKEGFLVVVDLEQQKNLNSILKVSNSNAHVLKSQLNRLPETLMMYMIKLENRLLPLLAQILLTNMFKLLIKC